MHARYGKNMSKMWPNVILELSCTVDSDYNIRYMWLICTYYLLSANSICLLSVNS